MEVVDTSVGLAWSWAIAGGPAGFLRSETDDEVGSSLPGFELSAFVAADKRILGRCLASELGEVAQLTKLSWAVCFSCCLIVFSSSFSFALVLLAEILEFHRMSQRGLLLLVCPRFPADLKPNLTTVENLSHLTYRLLS